ncbi:MAG: DEAD/DEAH box helicase [Gemmataceae bacterium]
MVLWRNPALVSIVNTMEDTISSEPTPAPADAPEASPPAMDSTPTVPGVTFADMNLIRPLADALTHFSYLSPTPIQQAVIPPALRGKDVIGQAQTGTGKTCAYLIPFLNRWRPHPFHGPIGLVMCPTRELALQVSEEAIKLSPSRRFRTVAVYGGARMGKQLEGLAAGCDLVVGTPGRLLDHLQRGTLTLEHVRYVVLDEADRMLDIGFRPDMERILRKCPDKRQTLLMSATVPDSIKKLVHRYMKEPMHLNMSPTVLTVDKIRQAYITVDDERKFELLLKVIEREQPRQCIIFCERKRWSDRLYKQMKPHVAGVSVIHGDLPQGQREKIMRGFREGKLKFLIATDVASRGIDVTGISHVINYDLPTDIENYVHRIGRTGRIGRDGVAISFVTPEQGGLLTDIEVTINRLIESDRIEGFDSYVPRKKLPDPPQPKPLMNADGTQPEPAPVEEVPPEPTRKAVFGKRTNRYSDRL